MSRIRKIYNYTYYFFRKYILKFFLRSVLILLGLNLLLILIANIPAVQTSMANRLVDYLEEKTGYPIDIRAASLNWFDELRLEGVDIRDLKNRSFIQVEELAIDFDIFALYKDNQIILDHAAIRGADVWVHEQDSTLDYSISEWTDALELALSDSIPADSLPTSSTAQPFYFLIKSVDLANSSFTLRHPSEEPLEGFDYMNFTLNDINLRLKKMEVIGGAFQTIIQRLSCVDSKTGIKVHNLSTFYRTSGHDMLYKNLDMKVGKSHIKGGMDWRYNDYEDFGDFYHKIRIKGWLEKTDVYSKDIGLFNEFMNFLPVSDYLVSGKFDGTVKNFTVEDFILKHRNSEIRANFNMYGLPDASETFMDVRLAPSEIVTSDLNTFFEIGSSIYNRLGKTTLNGSISGFLSDVVANLSLKSSIGKINTDLNIKVPLNDEEISYSGSLATEGFNLSQLLLLPVNTENMYLNGTLKGSGTSMETVKIDFDSRIDSVRLNQYTLTSAHIKTNLQQQRFDGNFEIEDPALSASVSMTANISPQTAGLNLTGDFKHIDFQALKFARYPAKLSTKLRIKLKGNEIDNTKGYIRFNNSQVGYKNRYLDIQKINLYSQVKNKNRTFELTSDFLDFYTHGNFKPSFLAQEIPVLFKSYQLELSNRRKALDSLLARQKRPADSLSLDFQLYLKNTSPLLELSESSLRVGKSSRFQGKINGADTLRISFQAYSDSLMHSGNIYEDVNFEMESQRPFNGSNTSTRITLTSDKQSFGDYLTTRHFITEWIWEKDKLNFFLETESEKSGIDLELNGTAEYQPNQSILHLNAPKLQIFNRNWKIASENKIKLNNNEISFQNVALYSGDELISLNGSVSPDRKKELALLVNELDLSALNLVSDHKIKGKLYASGTLKNLYGKPQITSSLEVNNINIDSTSIGNLSLLTHWNNVDSSFNVFGNLSQKKLELIDIQGQYTPHNGGILFEGAIHQIPFSYLTPFTKDYISQPEGQLKGHLMLSGHLDRPILKGYLSLDQTRLRVNYTNTDYEINGRVNINENLVNIESLTIKDNNFKTGSLKGRIKNSNFAD